MHFLINITILYENHTVYLMLNEMRNAKCERRSRRRKTRGKGQANVNSIHDDVFTICILDQNEIDKERERERKR